VARRDEEEYAVICSHILTRSNNATDNQNKSNGLILFDQNTRLPRCEHDAHPPLGLEDKLEQTFTLQSTRRVCEQLTVTYQRSLDRIEDTEPNRTLRGQRVQVCQEANAQVHLQHRGTRLTYRCFSKDNARVHPGAIIDYKILGPTLKWIADQQKHRDQEQLNDPKISLRKKNRIRQTLASHTR